MNRNYYRTRLVNRQDGKCAYCGCEVFATAKRGPLATIDHIIPVSAGGSDDIANLCAACYDCNEAKDSLLPHEFAAFIQMKNPAQAGAVRGHHKVSNQASIASHGNSSGESRGEGQNVGSNQPVIALSTHPAPAGADGQDVVSNQTFAAVCELPAPEQSGGRVRKARLRDATRLSTPSAPHSPQVLGKRTNTSATTTVATFVIPSTLPPEPPDDPDYDPTMATCSPFTERLIELQRARCMYIRRISAINLPMMSLVRRSVGYSTHDPKPIRDAAKARQEAIYAAFRGEDVDLSDADLEVVERFLPDYEMAIRWSEEITKRRALAEAEMIELAKCMPAAPFVERIKGLSLLSLAIIQAEARADLHTFHTPARLWARLGWGTTEKDGQIVAQTDCSRFRKAEVFARFATPFFTAQSPLFVKDENKKKTDEVKRDAGPYRMIYDGARARYDAINAAGGYAERAAYELKTKRWKEDEEKKSVSYLSKGMLTPMHMHQRSLRVMLKCALVDIIRASKRLPTRDWALTKPGESLRIAA